jgi:hypothetical protein
MTSDGTQQRARFGEDVFAELPHSEIRLGKPTGAG